MLMRGSEGRLDGPWRNRSAVTLEAVVKCLQIAVVRHHSELLSANRFEFLLEREFIIHSPFSRPLIPATSLGEDLALLLLNAPLRSQVNC